MQLLYEKVDQSMLNHLLMYRLRTLASIYKACMVHPILSLENVQYPETSGHVVSMPSCSNS